MTYGNTFTALADPTRRAIFEALWAGPKSVQALAAEQPVSRPAVSQHLKVLANAALVQADQQGKERIYSVRANALDDLRSYVERFWDVVMDDFKREVIRQTGEGQ